MLIDGGSAGAIGKFIELEIEKLRRFGQIEVANAEDKAEDSAKAFRSDLPACGIFGASPGGRSVEMTHTAVRQVYEEAMAAVVKDLEVFRDRVLDAAALYDATDDNAGEVLTRVGKAADGLNSADQAKQDAVDRNADAFPGRGHGPGGPGDQGARAGDAFPGGGGPGRGAGAPGDAGPQGAPAVPSRTYG